MPLVANSSLPTFSRLRAEGENVLDPARAQKQDIREMHIGLLNMMPDAALEATERQFFRIIGDSNQIAQFHMHPFSLPELSRGEKATAHIEQYYDSFESIKAAGLDALIELAQSATVAIMCSEGDYRQCHRHLLITQSLLGRNQDVIHIQPDGTALPGSLIPRQLSLFG